MYRYTHFTLKKKIEFDLSLVRGQCYYTGTIYEIESYEFIGAFAGDL